MASPTEEAPKPRRWLRLSVRVLMAVVLVLALGLAWVVRRAHVQRDAVAVIERSGGSVLYHWQMLPTGGRDLKGQPKWPKWLIDRLGVDYFYDVVQADLGPKATDAEMAAIARFDRLRAFSVGRAQVTDAGLAPLRGMTSLENIMLAKNQLDKTRGLTGACFAHLRDLPKLAHLHAARVRIADADLAHLAAIPALEWLDISFTPITDAGLAQLAGITRLTRLQLDGTGVTSAGLAHLKDMRGMVILSLIKSKVDDLGPLRPLTKLGALNLGGTPVDDADLASLEGLNVLKTLSLTNTKVTDAGLVHLRNLKNLTTLDLDKTGVTDAGLANLANMSRLKILRLGQTSITDAGLVHLAPLSALENIELSRTKITDAGLVEIVRLKSLKSLNVQATPALSDEGVAQLEQALPSLKVFRGAAGRPPVRPTPTTAPKKGP